MFEAKHRRSDVIRRFKVTKSAIVGLQKNSRKNIEKKCVTEQQKKCASHGSGVSLKSLFRSEFLIWGLFVLRILILDSEREGKEGVLVTAINTPHLTVKKVNLRRLHPAY